jgi:hypothetical protein
MAGPGASVRSGGQIDMKSMNGESDADIITEKTNA